MTIRWNDQIFIEIVRFVESNEFHNEMLNGGNDYSVEDGSYRHYSVECKHCAASDGVKCLKTLQSEGGKVMVLADMSRRTENLSRPKKGARKGAVFVCQRWPEAVWKSRTKCLVVVAIGTPTRQARTRLLCCAPVSRGGCCLVPIFWGPLLVCIRRRRLKFL